MELYVAEAGRGGTVPCVQHPGLGLFCLGFTGAVTRVSDKGRDKRVVKGLPSIINPDGETLGPSDLVFTASTSSCSASVSVAATSSSRGSVTTASCWRRWSPGSCTATAFSVVADVMANEVEANPDGTDIDSNPVGILKKGSGYVIADAGGNAIVRVSKKGNFTTIATLPPGSALAPPFLGLPPGTQIPTDAVPTSVVRGPGRRLLRQPADRLPVREGRRQHLARRAGQAPTVYASGLTNLTDLAFARDGSLYAVEIASNGLLEDRSAAGEGHAGRQSARDHRWRSVRAVWSRVDEEVGLRDHVRNLRRRGRGRPDPARLNELRCQWNCERSAGM